MVVVVEIEAAEVAGSNENAKMSEKRERFKRPLPFFIPNSVGLSWKYSELKPAVTSLVVPTKIPYQGHRKGNKESYRENTLKGIKNSSGGRLRGYDEMVTVEWFRTCAHQATTLSAMQTLATIGAGSMDLYPISLKNVSKVKYSRLRRG
ncbi:MAG: hypothetical protein WD032_00640 [Nitrospirales bacterium]